MEIFLVFIAIVIIIQSFITIFGMIYSWDSLDNIKNFKAPEFYEKPTLDFTILLPAYQEKEVIEDTIKSLDKIDYPKNKFEILVLLRPDDIETIEISNKIISKLDSNTRIILVNDTPRNKPNQLNWGLKEAKGDIVTVFDAEDEPSSQILNIMNTVFLQKKVDLVQCGVQLMNFRSNWFATLNVLEYYFWFKSSLMLFANSGIMPLGGNSIFIKRTILENVGGWNENCLTEDAELGIKLSKQNVKMTVMYDPIHATKEETPDTVSSFIQQRSRWVQGFFQILKAGDWLKLNSLKRTILAIYILLWPILQTLFFIYFILAITVVPFLNISLLASLISLVPLILLVIQIGLLNIGLWSFTRDYKLAYPIWMPLKVIITFLPYQAILAYSSFRAVKRELSGLQGWEKTKHSNLHRIKT